MTFTIPQDYFTQFKPSGYDSGAKPSFWRKQPDHPEAENLASLHRHGQSREKHTVSRDFVILRVRVLIHATTRTMKTYIKTFKKQTEANAMGSQPDSVQ